MKKNSGPSNHHLRKMLKTMLLAVVCLFLLTGCWDEREIEDRTSVTAVSIDKTTHGNLLVTVQIPIPMQIAGGGGSGGGGGGGKPVLTVSATGRTFDEALDQIQYKVNHKLFFGQMIIVAFSKQMAKSGIGDVIDSLRRMAELRRRLYPVVVENGKASDLLKINTDLEKVPAEFVQTMIQNSVRLGKLPNLTLGRFYIDLSNSAAEPAMLSLNVKKTGQVVQTGVAVFKGVKMVGLLDRQETSDLLRISSENGGGDFTFGIGKDHHLATFSPQLTGVDYHYALRNGTVYINVVVNMEGAVREVTYPFDFQNLHERKQLNARIEANMAKGSMEMIHKLQKYDSDILGFGKQVRAYHPEIWNQVDWESAFRNAKVHVRYHMKIRRTGMEMKNKNG